MLPMRNGSRKISLLVATAILAAASCGRQPEPTTLAVDGTSLPRRYTSAAAVTGHVLSPEGAGVASAVVTIELYRVQRFDSVAPPGYRPCDGPRVAQATEVTDAEGSFYTQFTGRSITLLGCVLIEARPPQASGLGPTSAPGELLYLRHALPDATIDSLVVELVAPRR
jgi:hypothetical protein